MEQDDPGRAQVFREISIHKNSLKIYKQDYYEVLPKTTFSICPFTKEVVYGPFDPVDFSGLWWMEFTRKPEDLTLVPNTFRVLRGAVNLHSLTCQGGRHDALVGPGIPYVISRILSLPTMIMVISRITMESGHHVYPLTYFSTVAPGPGQLTSNWLEKDQYYFEDESGISRWRIADDRWDFDLGPWIKQGKVRWILPEQSQLALESRNPKDCPYFNLQGVRFPQIINEKGVSTTSLPDPNAEYSIDD
jgi:hypothetical protein